jgi:hypothetical protein
MADCLRAVNCPLPMVADGAAGAGFNKAQVSSLAAIMVLLAKNMRGMVMSKGFFLTVLIMRLPPVLEQYTVYEWQCSRAGSTYQPCLPW